MKKPRLLVIGGKPFNIPPPLKAYFEIAKHIEQDQSKFSICSADYILVITNWVNHSAIQSARKALPNTPVVWVKKGWPSMRAEFIRRGIIADEVVPQDSLEPPVQEPAIDPAAESPVADDPFASMTEEQLELATRPDPKSEGAVMKHSPDEPADKIGPLWKAHVMKFVGDAAARVSLNMEKAVEFLSVALNEEFVPDDLRKELDLSEIAAHSLYISFGKSRGQFRARNGLPPIHTRAKPRVRTPALPPPPPPVPSEVDRMVQEFTRLTQEKSKLLEEQHVIEGKIEAVNKQLEIMKPFSEHFKGLAAAAKKVREALEHQHKK